MSNHIKHRELFSIVGVVVPLVLAGLNTELQSIRTIARTGIQVPRIVFGLKSNELILILNNRKSKQETSELFFSAIDRYSNIQVVRSGSIDRTIAFYGDSHEKINDIHVDQKISLLVSDDCQKLDLELMTQLSNLIPFEIDDGALFSFDYSAVGALNFSGYHSTINFSEDLNKLVAFQLGKSFCIPDCYASLALKSNERGKRESRILFVFHYSADRAENFRSHFESKQIPFDGRNAYFIYPQLKGGSTPLENFFQDWIDSKTR